MRVEVELQGQRSAERLARVHLLEPHVEVAAAKRVRHLACERGEGLAVATAQIEPRQFVVPARALELRDRELVDLLLFVGEIVLFEEGCQPLVARGIVGITVELMAQNRQCARHLSGRNQTRDIAIEERRHLVENRFIERKLIRGVVLPRIGIGHRRDYLRALIGLGKSREEALACSDDCCRFAIRRIGGDHLRMQRGARRRGREALVEGGQKLRCLGAMEVGLGLLGLGAILLLRARSVQP